MPVRLTQHVEVYPDKDECKRLHSRRKSRVSVYLTTARSKTQDSIPIFNETDVQNVLEEQQERKKKQQRYEKLRLVWKGNYELAKTPQEALNELQTSRAVQKFKFRFCPSSNRNKATTFLKFRDSNHTEMSFLHKGGQGSGNSSNDVDAGDVSSYRSYPKMKEVLNATCQKFEKSESTSRETIYRFPSTAQAVSDDVYGTGIQYSLTRERRYSRNIFNTKRATDNQEHNMFMYRVERKKTHVVTKQHKSNTDDDVDSLLSAIKKMKLIREKLVPEIRSSTDVDTLIRAYLSEEFLGLNLEGPEAAELRRMYTATILHEPVVHNLIMKHPDMLPSRIFKDLVNYKKGFEVNPIYAPTVVKVDEGPGRAFLHKTLSSPSGNVLIELEHDIPLYANFYKRLIEKRVMASEQNTSWIKEQKNQAIRENLLHLTVNLRVGRHNPGSTVRFDIIQLFIAAERNDRLLRQLGLTVEGWLDQLVKGLCSPFKSVREETCQVLCYMTSNYPVMKELYLSKYFDVVQDLCLTILRAIEQFEDTFSEYYILLAHLIHYCPSRSIIDCINERWMNFRCVSLILRWPRLIYYALRYWPDDALCLGSRLFFIRLTKSLEIALQRPVTAKVTRNALYYLQVRSKSVSHLFTIYHNKESAQTRFMKAHAARNNYQNC